jgi:flagellar protein FliS
MTMIRHRFAAARARYNSIDMTSRIEGASPHQLVAILFEELLKALDELAAATARKDFSRMGTSQSRALSMLFGLQSSLDMEKGGDLARNLAAIYAEGRQRTIQGVRERNVVELVKVREMLSEIATAWEAVG